MRVGNSEALWILWQAWQARLGAVHVMSPSAPLDRASFLVSRHVTSVWPLIQYTEESRSFALIYLVALETQFLRHENNGEGDCRKPFWKDSKRRVPNCELFSSSAADMAMSRALAVCYAAAALLATLVSGTETVTTTTTMSMTATMTTSVTMTMTETMTHTMTSTMTDTMTTTTDPNATTTMDSNETTSLGAFFGSERFLGDCQE